VKANTVSMLLKVLRDGIGEVGVYPETLDHDNKAGHGVFSVWPGSSLYQDCVLLEYLELT
jgi:hypothetical protein